MTKPHAQVVSEAAHIADLRDNWDGEGTPGYELATYERMRATLTACFNQVGPVDWPKLSIVPGPDSQIDVYCDGPGGSLTVYFPPPAAGQPEFHYQGVDGSVAQGLLSNSAGPDALLVALLQKLAGDPAALGQEQPWTAAWLDAVASGRLSMSQRRLCTVERRGGGLEAVRAAAQARGVHLLLLEDDHGQQLVAASLTPFRVIC